MAKRKQPDPPPRPRFWADVPMKSMTRTEWELLCDGCGKCCLNKLEYEDTGELEFTSVACRLLDDSTCRCMRYETRHQYVPECVTLTPTKLAKVAWWLPRTCAYRLLHEGKPLEPWHPLLSGDPESVHAAGISMRGQTVSETEVPEEDWEDHALPEPL